MLNNQKMGHIKCPILQVKKVDGELTVHAVLPDGTDVHASSGHVLKNTPGSINVPGATNVYVSTVGHKVFLKYSAGGEKFAYWLIPA